jgi:hypothetical protein
LKYSPKSGKVTNGNFISGPKFRKYYEYFKVTTC